MYRINWRGGGGISTIPNPFWMNGTNKIFAYYECANVNIGIGTDDPVYKLDVRDLTFLHSLKLGALNGSENALINGFETSNTKDLINLGVNNSSTSNTSDVRFKIGNKGNVVINNSEQTSLEINNNGDWPTLKINSTSFEPSIVVHNGIGNALEIYASNGSNMIELRNDGSFYYRMNGGPGFMVHDSNGNEVLRIASNGILYSKEIIVKVPPFPDYVFEDDYSLMPITEVEKYTKENKHLPGIPDANEMKNNGSNVGDMQVKQMEKIENIYLYLFEMEKRLNDLEKENKELKELINERK